MIDRPWHAVVAPGEVDPVVHRADGLDVVTLLGDAEAVGTFTRTERHRRLEVVFVGPGVWQGLAGREDFDGVRIDPLRPTSDLLGPHVPTAFAAGEDPRPQAGPLPARTLAEAHRWLDQAGARADRREVAHVGSVTTIRAWCGYDPREVRFVRVEDADDDGHLGEGRSPILCAGHLLTRARGALAGLPRMRWLASTDHRRRASTALPLVRQLLQEVEDGRIPFSALRTCAGAHTWHLFPEVFTEAWIRRSLRHTEHLAG